MKTLILKTTAVVLVAGSVLASDTPYPKAKVDFAEFRALCAEVEQHRAERLVDLTTFLEMSQKPNVIILDTRSAMRYARIHVKGAKHLVFSDFTQPALAQVIPSSDTTVLIYCNNNFKGNPVDLATKAFSPPASSSFSAEMKPRTLALNVPTFINLYGYGYRNVYELDEWVDVSDPRIRFEGTTVRAPSSHRLNGLLGQ